MVQGAGDITGMGVSGLLISVMDKLGPVFVRGAGDVTLTRACRDMNWRFERGWVCRSTDGRTDQHLNKDLHRGQEVTYLSTETEIAALHCFIRFSILNLKIKPWNFSD